MYLYILQDNAICSLCRLECEIEPKFYVDLTFIPFTSATKIQLNISETWASDRVKTLLT